MIPENVKFIALGVLAAMSFISDPALAATCTSSANGGNWSASSTWSCTGGVTVPGAGDDVIIAVNNASNTPVTVDVAAACNNLTINAPTPNNRTSELRVGAQTLTVNGNVAINGGVGNRVALLSVSTGTVTIKGNLTGTGLSSGAQLANSRLTFTGAGTLNIGGNFDSGVLTFTAGTSTVIYNGDGTGGTSTNQNVGAYTYNNLSVNKTTGTATLTGNATVNGNLSVGTSGGTLDLSTFTANRATAGGTLTVVNGATLKIGGTNGFPANYPTNTLGATSTVEYNGTSQPVSNKTYGHLILSGSGTKTPVAGTMTIQGNFTLASGVTYEGTTNNPTVNLAGNFTNSGTFNSGSGTFTFNGSAAQSLTGATTFTNMTLNNGSGLTLNNNVTVTGTLTFSNGKITTGSNKVSIGSAGSITGFSSARYVVGTLEKAFPGTGSFTFAIGDASNYTPVDVTFSSVTSTGSLAVNQTSGDHPNLATSTLDPNKSVNRYWTLTSTGLAGTYDATFNYVTGDKDAGSNPPDFEIERFSGGSWFVETEGTKLGTSTQAVGVTGFGDFAIAEPSAAPNHFVISHAGTGVNCQPEVVTITAHRANHNVITITGTVTLEAFKDGTATKRGDWTLNAGNGTFTPGASDSGTATYTFVAADNGVASFNLRYTYAETVNINVTLGLVTENSGTANNGAEPTPTDPLLTFVESGFRLTDGSNAAATVSTQIAGKESDLAPGAQSLALQAIRTDTDTGACVAVFANNAEVDIDVASECINPSTCAGRNVRITTQASSTNSVDVTNYDAGTVPATPASLTTVKFKFIGGNSEAPFTLNYPDAGILQLHFRRNIPLESGAGSGNFMLGSSNQFIVRPFGFHVAATGNPAATDENGGVFTQAGEDFTVEVTAIGWQAADDANSDGVPDGHEAGDTDAGNNVDLGDNTNLPNFGQENVTEEATLFALLNQPAGGNDPGLAGSVDITSFGAGTGSTTVNYGEVGIIEITALVSDGDYLGIEAGSPGETAKIRGLSGHVGRFTPFDFNVTLNNAPLFAPGCSGSFTYLDQSFDYDVAPEITITARNKSAITTQNYDGVWWKLADFTETYAHAGGALAGGVTLDDAVAGHAPVDCSADTCDGAFTATFNGPFMYARATTEVAPFAGLMDITFDIEDSDGVSYAGNPFLIDDIDFTGGNNEQRWGRLVVENASGSELMSLSLPLAAEYFDGTAYVSNVDDGCTALALADDIELSNPQTAGGAAQPGDAAMTVGSGTTQITSGNPALAGGLATLLFSAPGAGNVGFVDVLAELGGAGLDHLFSDWDGDGAFDDNPSGRATFGIKSGPDSLIYIRESW